MKIYLAGPIESAGGNMNMPLFDYVTGKLRAEGHEVFSPAEHLLMTYNSVEELTALGKTERKAARRKMLAVDLEWICLHADAMAMLPDWRRSPGARAEHALAEALGLEISELPNVVLPTMAPCDDAEFGMKP